MHYRSFIRLFVADLIAAISAGMRYKSFIVDSIAATSARMRYNSLLYRPRGYRRINCTYVGVSLLTTPFPYKSNMFPPHMIMETGYFFQWEIALGRLPDSCWNITGLISTPPIRCRLSSLSGDILLCICAAVALRLWSTNRW